MYEKLDKLRADLTRARQKKRELEVKIKNLEQRLEEAECAQILSDVKALHLTPEQLAEFLQLAAKGNLPMPPKITEKENGGWDPEKEASERQEGDADEEAVSL